ncbi:MAG: ABC transporter permease [Gammaproteobacteria bacterium]|nr:ABC transporter permease [Gammaproteobacteria bacterium]
MATVTTITDQIPSGSDIPLKVKLERAERMRKVKAVGLIMPLFVFLMISFVIPIFATLWRSIQNPEMGEILPRFSAEIQQWDGEGFPSNSTLSSFTQELIEANRNKTIGKVAKRLNYNITGFRSLLKKTGNKLDRAADKEGMETVVNDPNLIQRFIEIDKKWEGSRYWAALQQTAPPYTMYYLLQAVDREYDEVGDIKPVPKNQAIHVNILGRTIWISFMVTVLCLLLGYPIAYILATLPTRHSNLLMLLLLLPFWTSLLVRTTSWLVLLQNQGVVNDFAVWVGLWDEPLTLVRNRLGVYIAMVHILLPFMVLPLFSVMKTINPYHMKAAASMGAKPFRSFSKVYFPQSMPGIGAGVLLVFILSLGYYITPALVGGPKDQMLSYFIAFHANNTVNWGLAAALSVLLMVCVGIFFAMYQRLVGVGNIRMG